MLINRTMNPKLFRKAALYIMNLKVGDGYVTSQGEFTICVKHTKKKIVMSNGFVFKYKTKNQNSYLVGEPTGLSSLHCDTFYISVLDVAKWFQDRKKVVI